MYTFTQNDFAQMLTLITHNSVINEIRYPRSFILVLHGYQISLTFCTKWWNSEQLNVTELFSGKVSLLENRSQISQLVQEAN